MDVDISIFSRRVDIIRTKSANVRGTEIDLVLKRSDDGGDFGLLPSCGASESFRGGWDFECTGAGSGARNVKD